MMEPNPFSEGGVVQSSFQVRSLRFFISGLLIFFSHSSVWTASFKSQKAGFSVQVKADTLGYRIFGVYVTPGETFQFTVLDSDQKSKFTVVSNAAGVKKVGERSWHWPAGHEKTLVTMKIFKNSPIDSMILNVFVLVTFNDIKDEYLQTYRIGDYPGNAPQNSSVYDNPSGFIQVTEANQNTWISPHFQLKQFLCKQEAPFPKYVVVKERLLLLLERILEITNQAGYRCNTFHIMSGYRTPYYNQAIGNVKYSCHIYGAAVDFFIDENPKDDIMDDLNGDGQSTIADAAIIYGLIKKNSDASWFRHYRGGLAKYEKTTAHGPFIHVDVRGHQAKWGQ